MAEYALILFAVFVVCAAGFRVVGYIIERKTGVAAEELDNKGGQATAAQAKPAGSSSTASRVESYDGPAASAKSSSPAAQQAAQTSTVARFALVALGILGAAAVFFAIMRGKHAS